ncbi:complement factor H-like [Astyanax mexicanus]|uniref:Complement factor H-like n=1 Tax=Astyanax mexicanus TaxID=7994 RepID=A0A8T2L6D9_ASTMX|nr:complement factor H-like [Astyanax mexicanus]
MIYRKLLSDIGCEIPYDQHVYYPEYTFSADRRLGVTKSYSCQSGYKRAAERAECTMDGWVPNPLCIAIENTKPLTNPKHKYKIYETVRYQCLPGYEPERFSINCNWNEQWDNMKSCTARTGACGSPSPIKDAVQEFKDKYEDGEKATYECPAYYVKAGDPHLTCRQGRWRGKGECLAGTGACGPPPPIKDAVQEFKDKYEDGEKATYECPAYYVKDGDPHLTCRQGSWTGSGQCLGKYRSFYNL